MNNIDEKLLQEVAGWHSIPKGSYNIRKNGKSIARSTSADIDIVPKKDKRGIDIIVKAGIQNKSVHIPVIVTESGLEDLVYNDFYIGDGADVLIVAGCGIHNNGTKASAHNGIHTFHVGKNAKIRYVEKHLGLGNSDSQKILNPTTILNMEEGCVVEMETVQLGGVSYSNRETKATLKEKAKLMITEKILTTDDQEAQTKFVVDLVGKDSSVEVVSRSVAKGESRQKFVSKIVGKARCFGHVECDAILLDNARVASIPEVDAHSVEASLVHEAAIGRIASDQLKKLTTLGLTKEEAEDVIIKGYLN